jgi:hypothetical protein
MTPQNFAAWGVLALNSLTCLAIVIGAILLVREDRKAKRN